MPNFFRHNNTMFDLERVLCVYPEPDNKPPRVVVVLDRDADLRMYVYPPGLAENASKQTVWDALTGLVTEIEYGIYDDDGGGPVT